MPNIELKVAGRPYQIACREGQEAHFRSLGAIIDEKAIEAQAGLGAMSEPRLLFYAALLMADELREARAKGATTPETGAASAATIEQLAERIEALATALEANAATH